MRANFCLVVLSVACLAFSSCQREGLKIGKSNRIFGKLPALCMAEAEATKRLQEAVRISSDGAETVRYNIMLREMHLKVQERITAEWRAVQGREVPVESTAGMSYRVSQATASGWDDSTRTVRISCRIEPEAAGISDTACYLKCVMRDGTPLAVARIALPVAGQTRSAAGRVVAGKEVPDGMDTSSCRAGETLACGAPQSPASLSAPFEVIYDCSFGGVNLPDFTRFDRIVFIPRAEYEQLWPLASIRRPLLM